MPRSVPLTLAAYSPPMVDAVLGTLRPFLRRGDEVDLVAGNHDRPLSIETLNQWALRLESELPDGVGLLAHTSSLEKVATIATQGAVSLRSVLLDYEPNWDPEFTWEFGSSLAHFDQFASVCRAHGRRAIAYPTGRPLREGRLQAYGWDYGLLRGHVDEVYPQTQHWATLGTDAWTAVLQRLRSQWLAHGQDPRSLTVQLTIGDRENGVPASVALERYREASLASEGRLYLWWSPAVLTEVVSFLRTLDGFG